MNVSVTNAIRRGRNFPFTLAAFFAIFMVPVEAIAFCQNGRGDSNHDSYDGSTCHVQMIDNSFNFLRDDVLEYLKRTVLYPDKRNAGLSFNPADHIDSCDFDGGFAIINSRIFGSNGAIPNFSPQFSPGENFIEESDLFAGVRQWGMALHGTQDFYAHSNWVEMIRAFPLYNEKILDNGELIDSNLGPWRDITDDWTLIRDNIITSQKMLPDDWSWSTPLLNDERLPQIIDENGDSYWLLMSGNVGSLTNNVCPFVREGDGIDISIVTHSLSLSHDELNKDNQNRPLHQEAKFLGKKQTRHEWCRLLHLANQNDDISAVSVLMGLLVEPGKSPHLEGTACSDGIQGDIDVTISVESIKVINDHNTLPSQPGDLNFTLGVYTDDFRRSDRSQGNLATVFSGDDVPAAGLPEPVSLCVRAGENVVATVQGWEDDELTNDERHLMGVPIFGIETFPWIEPDINGELTAVDDILVGATRRVGSGSDIDNNVVSTVGTYIVTSDNPEIQDIEVKINVSNTGPDIDFDGLTYCQELVAKLDPYNPDTDDDGLQDGVEISLGTDPLKADTDEDGISDGDEVAQGTNPLLADTDSDGFDDRLDNCPQDVNVQQRDFDGDGMGDVCDPDDDNDNVIDEQDSCPATQIPESVPTDKFNSKRYALSDSSGSTIFESSNKMMVDTAYTGGCSCEQVVDQLHLGEGHLRHGCSKGVLERWHNMK